MFNDYVLSSNTQNGRVEESTSPVRDNKGRFVKGHTPFIRPKYALLKKYPKLLCDTCCKRDTCPEYHNNYVCAYKREFKKFPTRNLNHVMDALSSITNDSLREMQFAMVQETLSGEYSPEVTRLISKNVKRLVLLFELNMQIANKKISVPGAVVPL